MIPNDSKFSTVPLLCFFVSVCVCCAEVVSGIVVFHFTSLYFLLFPHFFVASSRDLPVKICLLELDEKIDTTFTIPLKKKTHKT